MRHADIVKLGDTLSSTFKKVVGYSEDLSDQGEFVLYTAKRLTAKENKKLREVVHHCDGALEFKVIVIGKPRLQ